MFTNPRALFWIGLLCFLPFLRPGLQRDAIPHGVEDRFTLGLPASPWLIASWTDTNEAINEGGSFSYSQHIAHSCHVEFLAWSWLLAGLGAEFLVTSRRLKAKQRQAENGVDQAAV